LAWLAQKQKAYWREKVILDITSRLLGETFTEINAEAKDCVGELTNMVTVVQGVIIRERL